MDYSSKDRIVEILVKAARILIITIALLVTVIPFVYLFVNSIKLPMEFLTVPPTIIPTQITWENYKELFFTESCS